MKLSNMFAAAAATTLAGTAFAVPANNPVWIANGTQVWFAGNDTQYPDIDDAINAASDGDIIMINAGEYVTSLHINNNDVTVVPCYRTSTGFDDVDFVNPTEGFNNANGYAIRMSGSGNSYVGMYRQFTQLSNGQETSTVIMPVAADWSMNAPGVPLQGIAAYANNTLRTFDIESRSIDNVAIYATDAQGTFSNMWISTFQGYGGGVIASGDTNMTQFIDIDFDDMIATGNPLQLADGTTGPAVNVITVTGGESLFAGGTVGVTQNAAGSDGIVRCTGGTTTFDNVTISNNLAWASNGTIWCSGADTRVNMSRCQILDNTSRFGTFYWDASGATEAGGYCNFMRCNFERNQTANTYGGSNGFPAGGLAWVDGAVAGDRPLINYSDCGAQDNNQSMMDGYQANGDVNYMDVCSEWHPYARIARPFNMTAPIAPNDAPVSGGTDVNGDGTTDAADLAELQAALGTCTYDGDLDGSVNIDDLLGVIAAYGSTCQ
ncbi:MAG: hypothetical protein CMJ39_11995 [Phycisphaerae bacterium]|nr:hypothetical protein [Phycisphaerae bacterium]